MIKYWQLTGLKTFSNPLHQIVLPGILHYVSIILHGILHPVSGSGRLRLHSAGSMQNNPIKTDLVNRSC